jgi:hypothetical protein
VSAALLGAAGVVSAASEPASRTDNENITLRHAPSGFVAKAPRGFRLTTPNGSYRIAGPGLSVTVSITTTAAGAKTFGEARKPAGAKVVLRRGNARRFRLVADKGTRRTSILVVRRGADLVSSVGMFAKGRGDLARAVDAIAASVRGGTPPAGGGSPGTTPPAATPAERLIPLRPYKAPDGGATAWVPSDPDWIVQSSQGALEGSSATRGNFLFGQTFSINLPGTVPPGPRPPSLIEHPFVSAADALTQVWPLIYQGAGITMTNVRIRQLIGDATLPTFRSSGMFIYDATINGRAYVGVINLATEDRLSTTSNFFWQMYTSGILVPADGDPTVGAALRLVWRSWNPSGAIASRSEKAREILNEINDTWKGVAEFRSRTADQQSRDVSCLLRTGPFIDDNARQLGLPPLLDCDSTYVPKENP